MDSSDIGPFERAFKRVSGAFAKGWKPGEFDTTAKAYFDGLRHVSIDQVVDAADRIIRTRTRFPKVAEWLADVGATTGPGTAPPGMRYMSEAERDEQARAAARRWRNDPCACLLCQAAGVTDRALRFVPNSLDDLLERAFNPRRNAVEIVGHWAHGEELRRWYAAQAAFYATPIPPPLRRVFATLVDEAVDTALRLMSSRREREPGEEG
jgi:hypothetical protein